MTTISAQTILRSRNAAAPNTVLSTLLLRYPRFIHAEMMTHRSMSRNSASSRAIPVAKLLQDTIDNPVTPIHWSANQKGMRADGELIGEARKIAAIVWDEAMHHAIDCARVLADQGAHKALVNRLLEPFTHITVLCSATEWDNFLELRDHPDAEPHMRMLAKAIRAELERDDNIQDLQPGQWHMPFVKDEDWPEIPDGVSAVPFRDDMIKLSVARCASTSYKTVDGFDMALDRAIALHDKLVGSRPLHASPCEHVAQADSRIPIIEDLDVWMWQHPHEHRNFSGFRQYRAQIERAV